MANIHGGDSNFYQYQLDMRGIMANVECLTSVGAGYIGTIGKDTKMQEYASITKCIDC